MKKLWKQLRYVLYLLGGVAVLIEVAYRYQWIDFYRVELESLNQQKGERKPNVLIFGDSFGAQQEGYIDQLRDSSSFHTIVNTSVPGTGAIQASYMAKRRLGEFKPEIVVFQVYVGNDLLDIHYPVNWNELPWLRNVYWTVAQRLRCLAFFNYKFGQLSQVLDQASLESTHSKTIDSFSVDQYSDRVKLYIKSDPQYLKRMIELDEEYKVVMEQVLKKYDDIIARLDEGVDYYFLVVPHCVQVNQGYISRYEKLGAQFDDDALTDRFTLAFEKRYGSERVIDALAKLRELEKNGTMCYYVNDPHMTMAGHKVLMESLRDKIEGL